MPNEDFSNMQDSAPQFDPNVAYDSGSSGSTTNQTAPQDSAIQPVKTQTQSVPFDPNASYEAFTTSVPGAGVAPSAPTTKAAPGSIKFDPSAPFELAQETQSEAKDSLGRFGGYAKIGNAVIQAVAGPGTAANTPLTATQAKELDALNDLFHLHLGDAATKLYSAESGSLHIVQGSPIEKAIRLINPEFQGSVTREQADQSEGAAAINRPLVDLGQFVEKDQHPIGKAIAETFSSLTTPGSLATMVATGGLGLVNSAQKLAMANKLISAGFAASAIGAMYQHSEIFKKAYDEGNVNEALYQLTHGVLSGATAVMAGAHAAGKPLPAASKTDLAVAGKVAEGASKVSEAAGKVVDLVSKPFGGGDLEDLYYKLSKPGKRRGQVFQSTIEKALPALKEVVDQNPNVSSPDDFVKAINQYRSTIDARILSRAEQLRGQPEAQMVGIEQDVIDAMQKAFKENEGRYTPEEQHEAELTVLNQLLQEKVQGGKKSYLEEPDLFQTENVRQRFNKDIDFSVDTTKEPIPAATKFAKEIAASLLRDRIDEKYSQLGINGVKQWRQQEASLIDVRDQIGKAKDTAKKLGEFNLFSSFLSQIKHRLFLLPAIFGGAHFGVEGFIGGGLAHALLGVFHEWMSDRSKNPNTLIERIVNKTLAENEKAPPQSATPTFSTKKATVNPRTISQVPEAEVDDEDFAQRRYMRPAFGPLRNR